RGGICPLCVLEEKQDRLPPRETLDLIEQCRQRLAALLRRCERERRISFAERDREQRRKKRRRNLSPRCIHGEDRFEFVELLLGRIAGLKPCRPLELSNERMQRAVGEVGRALITQARVRLAGNFLGESRRGAGVYGGEGRGEAGFAEAGPAEDQHDLPLALPREPWAFQQKIELVLAADEIAQALQADRLEAALRSRHAVDRPRRNRRGDTLDL